jgi:hypothetical protein
MGRETENWRACLANGNPEAHLFIVLVFWVGLENISMF